ncbi:MAG TPA: hypothetical protein VHH34_03450, partial [Pseudonocardiaceae bacterium]|nr:hypothetical protein [Pseudonocardiaceae bacterium]
ERAPHAAAPQAPTPTLESPVPSSPPVGTSPQAPSPAAQSPVAQGPDTQPPDTQPPQQSAALPPPPAPPAASARPQPAAAAAPRPAAAPDTDRPRKGLDPNLRWAAVLAAALVLVFAVIGLGTMLFGGQDGEQQAAPDAVPPPAVTEPGTEPEPSPTPAPPPPPPPPANQPVQSEGSIEWSNAGQLVIDYYNGLGNPSSAWQLLSPTAKASFGNSEAQFAEYWGQYSSVSAQDASGVSDNPDGSVTVPVTVTYNTEGGGQQVERQRLRVVRLNGQLLIDSDPR